MFSIQDQKIKIKQTQFHMFEHERTNVFVELSKLIFIRDSREIWIPIKNVSEEIVPD